jgi:hypothetical protein
MGARENDEIRMTNDEIGMTNDESNDEARMSNDEKMTKPEDHRTRVDDDSFWNDRKILVIREEAGGKFLKCIGTCRKEARETKHFLRMTVRAVPELKSQARELWIEAKELHLIFSKIWRSK